MRISHICMNIFLVVDIGLETDNGAPYTSIDREKESKNARNTSSKMDFNLDSAPPLKNFYSH